MHKAGLTLVEVAVSALLLGIAIIGIFALGGAMLRLNAAAEHTTHATILAEAKMEDLMRHPSYTAVPGTDTVDSIFTRSWHGTPTAGTWRVEVTVRWDNPQGEEQNVSLRNIRAN